MLQDPWFWGIEGVSDPVAALGFGRLDFLCGALKGDREEGSSTERGGELNEGDSANCDGSKSNHEPSDGHRGAPAWQKDGCVQHARVGRGIHR